MKQNKIFSVGIFLCLFLVALLSGCSTAQHSRALQAPLLSANEYLQLASSAQGQKKFDYQLQAVDRLLQDKSRQEAQSILTELANSPLNSEQKNRYQLSQAKLWLISDKAHAAIGLLQSLSPRALNLADQLRWHNLLAMGFEQTNNVEQSIIQSDMALSLLQDPQERYQQLLKTWQIIQNQSPNALAVLQQKTTDQQTLGWLQLAMVIHNNTDSTTQLVNALLRWQEEFPDHPANALLPNNLAQFQNQSTHTPKKIALLVPLSGPLSSSGTAIRNGFFAAYYYDKKQNPQSPTIDVIDTGNNQISQDYQQALSDGADFIVGPLSKNNLNTLIDKIKFTVPTLALNSTDNITPPANLYQFGLSPIDEANQMAKRAWDDNLQHALIIAPNNPWGHNIAQQLTSTWQNLGGQINGSLFFDNKHNLSTSVRNLLNINLSAARNKTLRQTIGLKTRVVLRRRKDIDVIFLIAPPVQARQIQPLLNYYYAGNIPIYATSLVYGGYPNPQKDRDLNGINFCDIPWVLDQGNQLPTDLAAIKKNTLAIWPASAKRHARLYALGVDAYQIIPHLSSMNLFAHLGIPAATGTLFLNQQNHIYRQLKWTEMRSGKPKD